jgi:hypothetical protein
MNLTAAELVQAKTDVEATLDELCTIKQRTLTNSGTGPVTVETDRATNVPCRRASVRNPQIPTVADANRAQEWVMVTIPVSQTIAVTDRVVIGSDSYEVVKLETTGLQVVKRAFCRVV